MKNRDYQIIKRKDAQLIYSSVCNDWKIEIANLLIQEDNCKTINVPNSLIERGYKQANADQKKLIEKYFKIESSKNLFSDIVDYKSFCKKAKVKELTLKDFSSFENAEKLLAFQQIKQIEKYFNGSWILDWSNSNQYKYYPYFNMNSSHGVIRFHDSNLCSDVFYGAVAFYKDREISDFVGRTFWSIYKILS